ncbi:HutD/Ves family protein [Neotabrizicola shimadae]|uniref:HutD family protein n=1 Tax=Neotabrizicola shimadae TaxID=2807096 RepID=A0A8G0ZVA7_9RHOB|nr:HutD family protein [Neotabrizicola shimadae]QYZ69502.1 HutD family protein [Neotabrizicola shimadae]
MFRHLTPADYRHQPWANGRGVTVELARADGPDGLIWRLSMATVAEDGPFSLFPGIERNLTVISGPGFRLEGSALALKARPMAPVAFPGDVEISAVGVAAPSQDFNVMTARPLPRPDVAVVVGEARIEGGGLLAAFALNPTRINGQAIGEQELILTTAPLHVAGSALIVRLSGPAT